MEGKINVAVHSLPDFVGDWKCVETENAVNFLTALGACPDFVQRMKNDNIIRIRGPEEGAYRLERDSEIGPLKITFRLDEEVEYLDANKAKVKSTIRMDSPTKFLEAQARDDVEVEFGCELNGNTLIATAEHSGVKCVMKFQKV
ncbi:unnamed protein product [Calicophoron daubneyi]|uniref:Uncharacterized protein n=1 Tax=Calicophoron daubneyi TaxID=300641 RepID=A0AAV2TPQ5_CALDB